MGKLDSTQWLIEHENIDKNIKDLNGNTSLHIACSNGYLDIAEYLVGKGCDQIPKNNIGDTPLHAACQGGYLPIVKYFIETVHIDKNIKGSKGFTPLHYACQRGRIDIVEYLVGQGCDVSCKNNNGNTPFSLFAHRV